MASMITDHGRKFRDFGIPFGGWGPVQCYLEPGAAVLIPIPRSVSPFKILKGQTV